MKLALNSDLKIKYYLNLYNEEGLHDKYATLFDIIQYILKVIEVKQKELSFSNIKFTSKTLKYIFGDKLDNETFKANVVKNIKDLISSEYLKVNGDQIQITEKGLTQFYTIG